MSKAGSADREGERQLVYCQAFPSLTLRRSANNACVFDKDRRSPDLKRGRVLRGTGQSDYYLCRTTGIVPGDAWNAGVAGHTKVIPELEWHAMSSHLSLKLGSLIPKILPQLHKRNSALRSCC